MIQKLVIDTDVGTDVDDLFALAYALKNPYCDVCAISTVIGDTAIRAKIVRKLERMMGVCVPITAGEIGSPDMVGKYWTGIEVKALSKEEEKEELPNNSYPVYTPNTRLVCIGPLTNIALQLETNSTIKNVKRVYIMGGTESAHNLKVDLDAWKKVQKQDWDIYQITKKVSEKISFDRPELKEFRGNSVGDFLYDSAIRWLDYTNTTNWIDHTPKTKCAMYDVLAVSAAIEEGYVKFDRTEENRFVSRDVDSRLKDKIIEVIKEIK